MSFSTEVIARKRKDSALIFLHHFKQELITVETEVDYLVALVLIALITVAVEFHVSENARDGELKVRALDLGSFNQNELLLVRSCELNVSATVSLVRDVCADGLLENRGTLSL